MDTYKEKYEAALGWMRKVYPTMTGADKEDAEHYFPELTESEDEKIRKELIAYHKGMADKNEETCNPNHLHNVWIAWLEKQKNVEEEIEKAYRNADKIQYEKGYNMGYLKGIEVGMQDAIEKQKGQKDWAEELNAKIKELHKQCLGLLKPAEWSEEDEEMLNRCISSIDEAKENRYAYKETDGDTSYDEEMAWLKSLCPQPQKLEDWTEEDERKYQCIRKILLDNLDSSEGKFTVAEILDWYEKKGTGRNSKYTWKPSEEQMQILRTVIDFATGKQSVFYICHQPVLESLYNDLKKLSD